MNILFIHDEKTQVKSFTIPDWPAVINLTLRAHTRLPALPTIGWDPAVADCESIIFEGNFNWEVNWSQIWNGKPLLQGELLDICEKRAGKRVV